MSPLTMPADEFDAIRKVAAAMSETEAVPEPDWLAAEPTARAKLTAIMAAVRRCQSECWPALRQRTAEPSGPHLSTTMAEVLIGQLLLKAAGDERERIRELSVKVNAGYQHYEDWPTSDGGKCTAGSYEPFADLLREPGDD